MREQPGLAADDTLLGVTSLSFDIAALEIYLPLTTGARLVLASRDTVTDASALAQRLKESRTSVMQATPSTWRMPASPLRCTSAAWVKTWSSGRPRSSASWS